MTRDRDTETESERIKRLERLEKILSKYGPIREGDGRTFHAVLFSNPKRHRAPDREHKE
jgi:hypothetical protein